MNPLASTKYAVRLLMALSAIASALFISSCGSSSSLAKPNNQGYSNSNLSGTYVFSSSGVDATNVAFLAAVGTVTADGNGNITGGMIDINGFSLSGPISTAITSGTYSVSSDGRGKATIQFSGGPATFDFVLTSSAGGLVTEFDGNGTGSGTLDLQTAGSLTGAYSFGLAGATASGAPLAAVGTFEISASHAQGQSTNGLIDINSNGTAPGGAAGLTLAATVTAGSPGTATLVALNGGSTVATYNFDVYTVDDTHLKFIETDTGEIMAGDAFTQQTSIPNGVYAYAMDGLDNGSAPLALAGFITAGSGSAISTGLEDYNDAGTTGQVTGFGGSYTSFSGGRTELTLNGIYNGVSGTNSDVTFAAYPSSGGIELLEIDDAGITGGVALPQGSATALGSSQGYGLNISAINAGNGSGAFEEDDIAEFVTNSSGSSFNGVEDINDEGTTTFDTAFNGTLASNSGATGYGTATSTSGEVNFNYYLANNGATALILEIDTNQFGTGIIEQQASAQSSAQSRPAAAHSHFSIVPVKPVVRAAWKNHNK